MTLRVMRSPEAEQDLAEVADYLAQQSSPRIALRFLDAAEATFSRLAALPGLGGVYESGNPRLLAAV